MSGSYQHDKTDDGPNCTAEVILHLLDRERPLSLVVSSEWTAEYVTRKVAVKYLGIGSTTLEVNYLIATVVINLNILRFDNEVFHYNLIITFFYQLFGLRRLQDGVWLAPNDTFKSNSGEGKQVTRKDVDSSANRLFEFEFRLRFKLPLSNKLLEIDKIAFNYYYNQVRRDYLKNIVCSDEVKTTNGKDEFSLL